MCKLSQSFLYLIMLCLLACNNQNTFEKTGQTQDEKPTGLPTDLPLDEIKLPPGFSISVFAKVPNARSLTMSPQGTIYVGNRQKNKVYALRDEDGDFAVEKVYVIDDALTMPNGVAFKDGSLYVAALNKILRYDNIEQNLANPPEPMVVYDKFPTETHHGWKFIAFGPDGKLYVPVGAPCNICESKDEIFASITRMNPDGSGLEVFSHGVRNSVGFDWHPDTKELWFTSNGRDMMGDDLPDDVLHRAPKKGMHFGYPYCHAGDIKDPEFGNKRPCSDFTPPAQKLGAHVAAIGMRFYEGKMFPQEYQKNIFIAKHGSWNRTEKSGYNISRVKLKGSEVVGHEVFAEGWLNETTQEVWGRPADVQELPDGSLLVSDDFANVVYRISYGG
ncbi:MAG: sorbosone dehydrogenase family protein [Microscillaceae bacterium]|nr:sorbosone dehydrogenase family protein [Microscillaceae bacterium]